MAIHDQNYVRYEGALHDSGAWRVIAWTGFTTYWSFLRTKLVLLILWLGPLFFGGLVLLEYGVRGQLGQLTEVEAPSGGYVSFYLQVQAFSLAVLLMASGCGVVSEDLRYRTFQLYFSKPLGKLDYGVGKFLSLVMLGSLITVVPAVLLMGLRGAFFVQTEYFEPVMIQMLTGVGLSLAFTLVMCAIVTGLSSTTARTGYVVLSWIGVLLVPLILHGIVAIATNGSDMASLWSLTGNMLVVSDWLLVDAEFEGPRWAAPTVLFVATALGLGAMARRISSLEGVA